MAAEREGASEGAPGATVARDKDELVRVYEAVHYPLLAHAESHPDRLAVIARLHGIAAPPVAKARVLDIGCAGGGNLASMAMSLPNADLFGIDISAAQIEEGRAAIAGAGIGNVTLQELDFEAARNSLKTFDYVIAHGVFSWVSRDAQDELFALIARCLAPNGVAYVSYNTRPGWQDFTAIREAVLYELRGVHEAKERIARARQYMAWLRESIPDGGARGQRFIAELAGMEASDDQTLLHDQLAPFNSPIAVNKLVARAARYGLWYLCDAQPPLSADHSMTLEAELARGRYSKELVEAEQHFDILSNTRFRRSLFCHRGQPLTRTVDARLVDDMFVSFLADPVPGESGAALDVAGPSAITFRTAKADLVTDRPPMKAALLHLVSVAPRAIPFAELIEAVRKALGPSSHADEEAAEIRHGLLEAFLSAVGTVTLRTLPTPCVRQAGERPMTSAWARQVARVATRIPNLDHYMVNVDPVVQGLLPMLDGTRDRATLEAELAAKVERGEIVVRMPDGKRGKPAPGAMDRALRGLARSSLLIG